jgi:hypothetical protein
MAFATAALAQLTANAQSLTGCWYGPAADVQLRICGTQAGNTLAGAVYAYVDGTGIRYAVRGSPWQFVTTVDSRGYFDLWPNKPIQYLGMHLIEGNRWLAHSS